MLTRALRGTAVVRACCVFSVWTTLLAGDAQTTPQSAPDQSSISVEVRAQQYWKAREARDLIASHPFYCAAYRKRVPLREFVTQTRLTRFELKDVKVTSAAPVGERFAVTVRFRFMAPLISQQPLDGQAVDVWAKDDDGQWCKEDEPLVLPLPKGSVAEDQGTKR